MIYKDSFHNLVTKKYFTIFYIKKMEMEMTCKNIMKMHKFKIVYFKFHFTQIQLQNYYYYFLNVHLFQ
jgi:hypothetical protein